jgi:hypothetical protein
LAQDPQFTLTRQKWIADEAGVKQLRELRKKVSAWWRTDPTGAVVLTVRYGAKPIEFAPGNAAIFKALMSAYVPQWRKHEAARRGARDLSQAR